MTTIYTRGQEQEPAINPNYKGPCFISERKGPGIDIHALMADERRAALRATCPRERSLASRLRPTGFGQAQGGI